MNAAAMNPITLASMNPAMILEDFQSVLNELESVIDVCRDVEAVDIKQCRNFPEHNDDGNTNDYNACFVENF